MLGLVLALVAVALGVLALSAGVSYLQPATARNSHETALLLTSGFQAIDAGFRAYRTSNRALPPVPWPPAGGGAAWEDSPLFAYAPVPRAPDGVSWRMGSSAEGYWICAEASVEEAQWKGFEAARRQLGGTRVALAAACGAAVSAAAPAAFPAAVAATYWLFGASSPSSAAAPPPAALNHPPVAVPDGYSAQGGQALVVAAAGALANDADADGDPLTVASASTASAAGGAVAVDPSGGFYYSPPTGFSGGDSFTYVVSDGRGGQAVGTVSVSVAAEGSVDPLAANDAYATPYATPLTVPAAPGGLLANDYSPLGYPLSVAAATPIGTLRGSLSVNGDGSLTYAPQANFVGTDVFEYAVADGRGGTAVARAHVTVTGSPPAAVADAYTTPSNTPLSVPAAGGLLANDTDPQGTAMTASAGGATTRGGVLAVAADGSFSYSPPANFVGTDSFTYTAADACGLSATALASVAVTARPPFAAADAYSATSGSSLTFAAPGVLANDTDPQGGALTVSWASSASARGAAISVASNGSFSYAAPAGFIGRDSFSYTARNPWGLSATATVSIDVAAAPAQPPTAVADSYTAPSGLTFSVAAPGLLANDADPQALALSAVARTVATARGGTATVSSTGAFSYASAAGFVGTDTFSYSVSNGQAAAAATVTMTVVRLPVVANDSYTLLKGVIGSVAAPGVLANDSHPDGLALAVSSTSVVTARGGLATFRPDGSFTYDPKDNGKATDTFTYTVSDGVGGTATGTVSLTLVTRL